MTLGGRIGVAEACKTSLATVCSPLPRLPLLLVHLPDTKAGASTGEQGAWAFA